MKDVTGELLSFDETLYKKRDAVLGESAHTITTADKNYEQILTEKKTEFTHYKKTKIDELERYLVSKDEAEKQRFLKMQMRFKEEDDTVTCVGDILKSIQEEICKGV